MPRAWQRAAIHGALHAWILFLAVSLAPTCTPASLLPFSLDAGLDLPDAQRAIVQAGRRAVVSIFTSRWSRTWLPSQQGSRWQAGGFRPFVLGMRPLSR